MLLLLTFESILLTNTGNWRRPLTDLKNIIAYAGEDGKEVSKVFYDYLSDTLHNTWLSLKQYDGVKASRNSTWAEGSKRVFGMVKIMGGDRLLNVLWMIFH